MVRIGVVDGAVRRELDAQLLRHRSKPELTGEIPLHVHIEELRVIVAELQRGKFVAARLQIEIVDVVERRMAEDDVLLVLEERLDPGVRRGKERVLLEVLIDIRQDQPLAPLAVGEMKFSLGIEQDVLPLQHAEVLVGQDIAEGADLRHALIDAGTFDVEKDVFHERGISFSVPPMYGRSTAGMSTLPSALR